MATPISRNLIESKPNISNPIIRDVIGLLVTPQKTATIPTAAQSDGDNPTNVPKRHPKVAPIQKEGTISPPLNPTPSVMAVKMIFQKINPGKLQMKIRKRLRIM